MHYPLNDGWRFAEEWSADLSDPRAVLGAGTPGLEDVRLPHTVRELPVDSFSERAYECLTGYVRVLSVPAQWQGKSVRITFEGLAHHATFFVNGAEVGQHKCGYTAVTIDLTAHLAFGSQNTIAVRLDSRSTLDQPPFGGAVDYMTFGGIYRGVHVAVTEVQHLSEVAIAADGDGRLAARVEVAGAGGEELELIATLRDAEGDVLAQVRLPVAGAVTDLALTAPEVTRWHPASPALYDLVVSLVRSEEVIDEARERVGFRTIEFGADGLRINGERVELVGLNRHQSWPYLGYAVPARAQRLDADILRNELGCTVVRTSHYPQSHDFISRCDELGLLVITEIPGWQYLGGEAWKRQAVQNTEDMVRQWRNHPSIIAWGVRVNESPDDDELYAATNAAARRLDPTRPTTGVRNSRQSSFLEDVYAYNDFVHTGTNPGCEPPAAVTPDTTRPYLISEHTGHVFPTKTFDSEGHRIDHAMRHARVVSDAVATRGIAGVLGWAMFDYNTQRDFGSGDRVCHHGVLDMFRNPKIAAALYRSQGSPEQVGVVLEPASAMEFGDRPAGSARDVTVFTNADEVHLYRDDDLVKVFTPSLDYPGLAHPPVVIDDLIGDRIARHEDLSPAVAETVKRVLLDVARFGVESLPEPSAVALERLLASGEFTIQQGMALFDRYLGSWGGRASRWRFDGLIDGTVVARVVRAPAERVSLRVSTDTTTLRDGDTWDIATIRVQLVDEHGNLQRYARRSVQFQVAGAASLVGPSHLALAGGAAGAYVRTIGRAGEAALTVSADGAAPVTIEFSITREPAPSWR